MANPSVQLGSLSKEASSSNFVNENEEPSKSFQPGRKDFYWDDLVFILVTATLTLTILDVVAEYFRGAGVRCFSPSTSGGNESEDFTRAQADFVNSFCYQSLQPTEYYTVFILAHGLGLWAPHYVWKALFEGHFGFFFELAKKLKRLRNTTTGDYDENNFEIVRKLQDKYASGKKIFRVYYFKLLLQLGIAVFTLLVGALYFDDFSPSFICPSNSSSRLFWPLDTTNVTCVYTSLRFLSVIQVVDLIFVGLTIPILLYGLGWCFIRHNGELGYAKFARFVADSCFLAKHYTPKSFHFGFHSQFRISNDLDFLLMQLFRTDTGHGEVFREIQIENELLRLNKQDSEWLQYVIDNSSDKSAPRYLTAQTVQTAKNPGDSRRQHIYHRFGASEMNENEFKCWLLAILKKQYMNERTNRIDTGTLNAMDVSFGSTGSAHILPWFFRSVLSVNFDSHIKEKEVKTVMRRSFDNNVIALRSPADIFVHHNKRVMELRDELREAVVKDLMSSDRDSHHTIDFIVVAPMETREKEVTVDLLLNKLHCLGNETLITTKAYLLTVRPLQIDGEDTADKFIDYMPEPSLFGRCLCSTVHTTIKKNDLNCLELLASWRRHLFKKDSNEIVGITLCGSVRTIIKFTLYQYEINKEMKAETDTSSREHAVNDGGATVSQGLASQTETEIQPSNDGDGEANGHRNDENDVV